MSEQQAPGRRHQVEDVAVEQELRGRARAKEIAELRRPARKRRALATCAAGRSSLALPHATAWRRDRDRRRVRQQILHRAVHLLLIPNPLRGASECGDDFDRSAATAAPDRSRAPPALESAPPVPRCASAPRRGTPACRGPRSAAPCADGESLPGSSGFCANRRPPAARQGAASRSVSRCSRLGPRRLVSASSTTLTMACRVTSNLRYIHNRRPRPSSCSRRPCGTAPPCAS